MIMVASADGPDAQSDLDGRCAELRANERIDNAIFFWRGTSGHAYVHTVYALVSCPPMPEASVLFVRRTADGKRRVLDTMCVENSATTLNLARVRHRGAEIGANEVHLHFAASGRAARCSASLDLRIGNCGVGPVGS